MAYDWRGLLTVWSKAVIEAAVAAGEALPPEVVAAGWLGYSGASEAQIAAAETRLGRRLPPSYREFLAVTNGWRQTGPFIDRLWSTDEIEWFRVRNQEWIDAYTGPNLGGSPPSVPDADYFVYGEGQDAVLFRHEYLRTALEISDVGDSAIYLLNPQVVTADGEWEAWFFANWLPGAARHRSFWEMMLAEYRSFLNLEAHDARRMRTADPLAHLPAKLPGLIDELLEQARAFRRMESQLLDVMGAHNDGIARALEQVAERVRGLQAAALDPAALLAALRALAEEATREQLELQAGLQAGGMAAQLASFSAMEQAMAEFGRAEGLRQAAGRIEWFIRDAGAA